MGLRAKNMMLVAALWAGAASGAGCSHPRGPAAIGDPDTDLNVLGIKKAVRNKDLKQARKMIEDLDSDDPAVRFYGIRGLKDLTGETFGYVYYQDDDGRREAAGRWRQWLTAREAQASGGGGGSGARDPGAGGGR